MGPWVAGRTGRARFARRPNWSGGAVLAGLAVLTVCAVLACRSGGAGLAGQPRDPVLPVLAVLAVLAVFACFAVDAGGSWRAGYALLACGPGDTGLTIAAIAARQTVTSGYAVATVASRCAVAPVASRNSIHSIRSVRAGRSVGAWCAISTGRSVGAWRAGGASSAGRTISTVAAGAPVLWGGSRRGRRRLGRRDRWPGRGRGRAGVDVLASLDWTTSGGGSAGV